MTTRFKARIIITFSAMPTAIDLLNINEEIFSHANIEVLQMVPIEERGGKRVMDILADWEVPVSFNNLDLLSDIHAAVPDKIVSVIDLDMDEHGTINFDRSPRTTEEDMKKSLLDFVKYQVDNMAESIGRVVDARDVHAAICG